MFSSSILVATTFGLGAFAQNFSTTVFPTASVSRSTSAPVTARTTLNLFLDAEADQGFVGSIITADACTTEVALVCTSGDYGFAQLTQICDPLVTVNAVFAGSTGFEIATDIETSTLGVQARVSASESCSLEPTSLAVCDVLVSLSVEGEKTQSKSTATYSAEAATNKWFQVPITAGAEKLPAATATCSSNPNAAAGFAQGLRDVYKVVVVPGAAALLAGAAVL